MRQVGWTSVLFSVGAMVSALASCSESEGGSAESDGTVDGVENLDASVGRSESSGAVDGTSGNGSADSDGHGGSSGGAGSSGSAATAAGAASGGNDETGGSANGGGSGGASGGGSGGASGGGSGGASGGGNGGASGSGGTSGSGASGRGGTSGRGGASGRGAPCSDAEAQDYTDTPLPCGEADLCDPDPMGRSWSPPVRIDDGTACVNGTLRVVLIDDQPGIVAWLEDGAPRLRLRRVADGKWESHEELPWGFGRGLAIAVAETGHVLVLGEGAGRLRATVSSTPGDWSSLDDVANADVSDSNVQIAVDENGRAFAVWPLSESEGNIGTATWTAETGWTDLGPLTSGNAAVRADVAPVFGGGGFVVGFLTTSTVFAAFYDADGVRTGSENVGSLVTAGAGEQGNVNVEVDPTGAAHMVWTAPEPDADPADLNYRLRRASDEVWFIRTVIDNRVDPSFRPLFSTSDEGDFILVWRSADPSRTQHAHFVREGPATQDIRRFDAPSVETQPAVAMDAQGNALIVWGSTEPGGALVRANRYYAGEGWEHSFHRDLYPGEEGETVPEVAVAMSDSGNALVAYVVRTADGNDRVYAHVLE